MSRRSNGAPGIVIAVAGMLTAAGCRPPARVPAPPKKEKAMPPKPETPEPEPPEARPPAVEVFAVSDVYGIRPDGGCFELPGDDLAPLRRSNAHWDAASRTVRLYGARNEEAAVQLVIPEEGEAFSCRLDHLDGVLFIDRLSQTNLMAIREELDGLEQEFNLQRRLKAIGSDEEIVARLEELEAEVT